MALNRTFILNNGVEIPAVGFGTWQAKPDEVRIAVEIALRTGYRHLDCAAIYRNEVEVGEGIRASGVDRKDIFVSLLFVTTSKCYLCPLPTGYGNRSLRNYGTISTSPPMLKRHWTEPWSV